MSYPNISTPDSSYPKKKFNYPLFAVIFAVINLLVAILAIILIATLGSSYFFMLFVAAFFGLCSLLLNTYVFVSAAKSANVPPKPVSHDGLPIPNDDPNLSQRTNDNLGKE